MLTAILAVRNLFGEHHDIWAVNAEEEYHEEIPDMEFDPRARSTGDVRLLSETQPLVPIRLDRRRPRGDQNVQATTVDDSPQSQRAGE